MPIEQDIYKAWKYEFDVWIHTFHSIPIKVIRSVDHSQSYVMDRRHVFLLENGKYAFVRESGCSCYIPMDAEIDLCSSLEDVKRAWNEAILEDTDSHYYLWLNDK